jgi:hypothetical protein
LLELIRYVKNHEYKWNFVLKLTYWCSLIFVTVIYSLSLIYAFDQVLADKYKAIDAFTALAQIATALTFILALYQLKKNGNKAKQDHLFQELKSLTSQMVVLCEEYQDTEIKNVTKLNRFISRMSNLGQDFFKLYAAIEDDTYKITLRIHWQNMFYNDLHHLLRSISYNDFITPQKRIERSVLLAKSKARKDFTEQRVHSSYKSYFLENQIVSNRELKLSLIEKLDDFSLFKFYFLNNENLNDILQGILNKIDIKITFPFLAAIEDAKK